MFFKIFWFYYPFWHLVGFVMDFLNIFWIFLCFVGFFCKLGINSTALNYQPKTFLWKKTFFSLKNSCNLALCLLNLIRFWLMSCLFHYAKLLNVKRKISAQVSLVLQFESKCNFSVPPYHSPVIHWKVNEWAGWSIQHDCDSVTLWQW